MTEDWLKRLDERESVAAVAVDLSKLKAYMAFPEQLQNLWNTMTCFEMQWLVLKYNVSNISLIPYADDATEYASDVLPILLEYTINEDLKIVSSGFECNYLKTNESKTQDHIAEKTKKACTKASAMRRIRRFFPQDVMIRLYKAQFYWGL